MNKKEILEAISGLLEQYEIPNGIGLELEDNNFRVKSDGWKKITVDEKEYLENPEADIWEILDGEARGEQLFTFNAAKRETKKAGGKIPTDEELSKLTKTKEDIKNLKFSGDRNTDGSFYSQGAYAYLWSASDDSATSGWYRYLYPGFATVGRGSSAKAHGFSVRCLKNK